MERQNYWNRRLSRRRALAGAATGGVGLAGLALAGCGDDDDSSDAKPIEQKQEEVQSILSKRVDTSAQAVKGGILEFATTADVTNLDPLSSTSFTANVAGNWMYPKLTKYKSGYRVPSVGEIEPYLAESWQQPEPTKLIFKLRQNAVWDSRAPTNKRPVDADDVVFSWNKFAAKSLSRKDLANLPDNPTGPVLKVEATDKTTVVFTLAFPYAAMLAALAYSRYLQIMPRESDGGFDPRNETRGAGPYILQNYQKNVAFQYRKNPDYWDASKLLNDGVNYPIIPEYASGLAQFKAKKVWGSFGVRQEDIISTKKEFPELVLDRGAFTRGQSMLYFGLAPDSPFADPRVRQAASMAIDRDAYLETFNNISTFTKEGYPVDVRLHSHVSSGWDGWWLDPKGKDLGEGAKNFAYNAAEAKKLLSAAGYANGVDTQIAYIQTGEYGTTFPKQGEVLKGLLEADGLFKLKLVNPDYQTEYLPKYYFAKGDFKGIAWGATTQFPEIDQYLFAYFHSQGSREKSTFQGKNGDTKSDGLIEAQRKELDGNKRRELVKEWQRYAATWMPQILSPGTIATFTLVWPWVGNSGVFRSWDAESDIPSSIPPLWFDKSKFTG